MSRERILAVLLLAAASPLLSSAAGCVANERYDARPSNTAAGARAAANVTNARPTGGQSVAETTPTPIPTPIPTPVPLLTAAALEPRGVAGAEASSTADVSAYIAAAALNARLGRELEWTFGGKPQRGWALYAPLVARLIRHEGEGYETAEFAAALARWQRWANLAPSGALEQATLLKMVSTWQSARPRGSTYPTPDRLVVAPASVFYDPARPDELRQVERETFAAYRRLLAAAAADKSLGLKVTAAGEPAPDEKFLKIVSSFRSREYQDRLRRQSPNSGRAGLAVNSPHFTGRALDLYVGGDPVETKDENRAVQVQTPAYRWLIRHAEEFGFRPYFFEPWHWEYVGN